MVHRFQGVAVVVVLVINQIHKILLEELVVAALENPHLTQAPLLLGQ